MSKTLGRWASAANWRWASSLLVLGPLLVPGHGQSPAQAAEARVQPALARMAAT